MLKYLLVGGLALVTWNNPSLLSSWIWDGFIFVAVFTPLMDWVN